MTRIGFKSLSRKILGISADLLDIDCDIVVVLEGNLNPTVVGDDSILRVWLLTPGPREVVLRILTDSQDAVKLEEPVEKKAKKAKVAKVAPKPVVPASVSSSGVATVANSTHGMLSFQ